MFFNKTDGERGGKGTAERGVTPLLPLRDIIVFPYMVSQLFVGRERSIAALNEAMNREKEIFLAAQKNAKTNEPAPEDIFTVGTIGTVMQLLRLPDGTVKVLVEGKQRARIKRFADSVDVPPGWQGKMPNGDPIGSGATFLSIRSKYKNDPSWPRVDAYLRGGPAPTFTYHRLWAESDIAIANAMYGWLNAGAGKDNVELASETAAEPAAPASKRVHKGAGKAHSSKAQKNQ